MTERDPHAVFWRGKRLSDMSREELLEVVLTQRDQIFVAEETIKEGTRLINLLANANRRHDD